MTSETISRALVADGPLQNGLWSIQEITLREIKDNELVVRLVGSGICHTDILFGSMEPAAENPLAIYPRILGHEGSGYVERVGSKVTVAQPGDPVLLSFLSCGTCGICKAKHQSCCVNFTPLNFIGTKDFHSGAAAKQEKGETQTYGSFFGQSSFASRTIANERSVVNVKGLLKDDDELRLLSPLGCGIQTGSGTIWKVAAADEEDCVAIVGLGGVGLSAIMAAKICKSRVIIGIDRLQSRLELAKELGATHVINTANFSRELDGLVEAVKEITDGIGSTITMDTTGYLPLVKCGVDFTRNCGKIIQVGSSGPTDVLPITLFSFMTTGKQLVGAIEGDATPAEYIPEMIKWWREGKLPMEKLVKFFKAEDWEKATQEMHDGTTVKPVIYW